MTCTIDHAPAARLPFREAGFWQKLSFAFRRRKKRRLPALDPRELPDHMKRDLGFLDGRSGR